MKGGYGGSDDSQIYKKRKSIWMAWSSGRNRRWIDKRFICIGFKGSKEEETAATDGPNGFWFWKVDINKYIFREGRLSAKIVFLVDYIYF